MEARTDDFVAAMMAETGATRMWCGFNVHLAASMLRQAAALTTQVTGEVIPFDRPGCLAMAIRRPAGVVLGIAPWNAPVILGVRAIATALACGNTVVLKASEACPATHWLIGDVLRSAGFPAGVVNVVSNAPADAGAVVEALVRHKAVRRCLAAMRSARSRSPAGSTSARVRCWRSSLARRPVSQAWPAI